MSSLLKDAFDHHSWATLNVLDACAALPPAILEVAVMGDLRHDRGNASPRHRVRLVLSRRLLWRVARASAPLRDTERVARARCGPVSGVVGTARRRTSTLTRSSTKSTPDDGYRRDATVGLRLAQALHHGNDHRSQICTTMSAHGFTPPPVSVWEYGFFSGRASETLPR